MGNAIRREEAICKEFMWFVLAPFLHLGTSSFRAENEIFLLSIQFGLDRKITIALTWDILLVFIWPWWIHILLVGTGGKINDLQWTECVGHWWMSDPSLPMQPRSGNLVLKNICSLCHAKWTDRSQPTSWHLQNGMALVQEDCPLPLCLCVSVANSWRLCFSSPHSQFCAVFRYFLSHENSQNPLQVWGSATA